MEQQGYLELGIAMLDRAWEDLAYAKARNRKEYRSARRFMDSGLFGVICRAAGADPGKMRRSMLWYADRVRRRNAHGGRGRAAESRSFYRA